MSIFRQRQLIWKIPFVKTKKKWNITMGTSQQADPASDTNRDPSSPPVLAALVPSAFLPERHKHLPPTKAAVLNLWVDLFTGVT